MRADEFIKEEEKLDEILPLITGAASLVGGAAKLAGGVASGVGAVAKGVGKGVGAVARGAGQAVGAVGSAVAKKLGPKDDEEDSPELDQAKDQMLKPGNDIELPTSTTGGPSKFKVTGRRGPDVELQNPDAATNAQEPAKIVYKADALKKVMSAK